MKITLLKPNGVKVPVYQGQYKVITLDEMYELIGCELVERLPLPTDDIEIWIDEEGKLKNNWVENLQAEELFRTAFAGETANLDPHYDWRVAGNALVVERSKAELDRYYNE